jgi:hypothetical protein
MESDNMKTYKSKGFEYESVEIDENRLNKKDMEIIIKNLQELEELTAQKRKHAENGNKSREQSLL